MTIHKDPTISVVAVPPPECTPHLAFYGYIVSIVQKIFDNCLSFTGAVKRKDQSWKEA